MPVTALIIAGIIENKYNNKSPLVKCLTVFVLRGKIIKLRSSEINKLREELLKLLKKEAFRVGEIVLSSGKTSFYLDGRCS